MGCIQSQSQRPPLKKKKKVSSPSTPTQEELEAARLLAAKSQTPQKAAAAEAPRRETDVLRRAGAMDRAHEEALKSPSLQKLEITPGDQTQRLLHGFAMKEADAHAKPELRSVESTNLRDSKIFSVLKGFEEKEERARSEPRLEKTFSERERERSQASLATPSLAAGSSAHTAVSSLSTL